MADKLKDCSRRVHQACERAAPLVCPSLIMSWVVVHLRLRRAEGDSALAYADLFACGVNCSALCTRCDTPEQRFVATSKCRPNAPYNCSATCFGERCPATSSFCTVHDHRGQLGFIDLNCTREPNVTLGGTPANLATDRP